MAEETLAVEVPVVVDPEPTSVEEAVKIVLRKAMEVNGVVRGLSEVARALDRRSLHMCILAEDCEDEAYKKLITALASQGGIDLINVEEREKLAEWVGLARQNATGETKKVLKCSCVGIREYGERTRALTYLLDKLGE